MWSVCLTVKGDMAYSPLQGLRIVEESLTLGHHFVCLGIGLVLKDVLAKGANRVQAGISSYLQVFLSCPRPANFRKRVVENLEWVPREVLSSWNRNSVPVTPVGLSGGVGRPIFSDHESADDSS